MEEKSKQWPQFLVVTTAGILAIGTGLQMGWPGPSVLKMAANDYGFPISPEAVSGIVMIAPLGYLIGGPFSGFMIDKMGRKYLLLILSIPQIISWLLIATASNVPILFIARFCSGISDGGLFTTLPIYMAEVSEPKIRGIISSIFSIGLLVGILFINAYGAYLCIRTTAYVSLCIPLLFIVTFMWMPKSPYSLILKGRVSEARQSLQWLRRMKNVDSELENIESALRRQTAEPGRFIDILKIKSNLKALLLVFALRASQQFSGLTALGFYIQYIFKEAGGNLTPAQSAIICCMIQIIFCSGSSVVVDRFGRRLLIIFSSVGSAVLLFILGLYFCFKKYSYDVSNFSWLPLTAMIVYYMVLSVGLISVPTIMTGELLSASIKSRASIVINVYFGICMTAATVTFQLLNSAFGIYAPFMMYAACCAASAVFCYFLLPETKGKTLDNIQLLLKGTLDENKNNQRNQLLTDSDNKKVRIVRS